MRRHEFELVVSGLDLATDESLLAKFATETDDVTFTERDGDVIASVERRAATLADAIYSAIADIEIMYGVAVDKVLPEEFLSQPEIARRIGRTRQSVAQLVNGTRGPGGFPAPSVGSGRTALWRWATVANWLIDAGIDVSDVAATTAVIDATNALLEARRVVGVLSATDSATLLRLVA